MEKNDGLNQERAKNQITQKLNIVGERLLETAVVHTSVWKRSKFDIPLEKTQDFYQEIISSPIGAMFKDLNGYKQKEGSDKPYDWQQVILDSENPTKASLSVEKFGPYDEGNSYSNSFSIIFYYDNEGDEYYLKASLTNSVQERYENKGYVIEPYNDWDLSSKSFQLGLYETGYEGSDIREPEEIDLDKLDKFYSIFKKLKKEEQAKEKTLSEQMSEVKLVNQDTGEEFYFDPLANQYLNKDGKSMEDADTPLKNLPTTGDLKLVAEYSMEPLKEGEEVNF